MTEKQLKADLMVVQLDRARTALAEAKTIGETKKIVDMAHAAQIYASRQALGEEAIAYALAIKFEAMRKLGIILASTPKALPGREPKAQNGYRSHNVTDIPTLAELGIDKRTSTVAQQLAAMPAEQFESVISKGSDFSFNRVLRDWKKQQTDAKREKQKSAAIVKRKSVDGLYHGDFRKIGHNIPDASVDLIFTDPPYDRKAIPLFDGLGEFAARVLRPGGSLITYVGQIQLPDAITDLAKHLRYWWTCSCYHSGPTLLRMNEYGIINGWKPMLWFVKETRGDKNTFVNDVATGTREKSHHEWQQAEAEARYFVELLTEPDGFVVDPFCGGGTTPAACIGLGRKWAAFEIDEANLASASLRIAEAQSG